MFGKHFLNASTNLIKKEGTVILASCYELTPPCLFTKTECIQGLHKVTYKKIANCVIEHSYNVIIKYPETSDAPGITFAHTYLPCQP